MKRAVILLSGGLDSATVLAMAKADGFACYTLSFDYGQRNYAELKASVALSAQLGAIEHKVIKIDLGAIGGSALTDNAIDVPVEPQDDIPVTYVPARNTIFLAVATGFAEVLRAQSIHIGVNALDYSGYPDCRAEYIAAFETMANLATKTAIEGNKLQIRTPLIELTKAQIISAGTALGVDYSKTVSCYQADELGRACGVCDACRLRKRGFEQADLADPTHYQR